MADSKPSVKSSRGLTVSECYFLLPTASDSVDLAVMQKENEQTPAPKQLWTEIFHGNTSDSTEKKAVPQPISGLGDEAFWIPDRFGGALYVLKGENYIRLSIGGPGDQPTKIRKSQSLAEIILGRL